MSREETVQKVLWHLGDYKSMANLLQEVAYRLTELREGWGLPVEALSSASGLSLDTVNRFEGLGAASVGARLKGGRIAEAQDSGAGRNAKPRGIAERVELYKALARLVEELAHQLMAMTTAWDMFTEVICRASGVSQRLITQVEIVAATRLPELQSKKTKTQRRKIKEAA